MTNDDYREIEVPVPRTDLLFLHRVIDTALAELSAAVADGDVDESVLNELEEGFNIVQEHLS